MKLGVSLPFSILHGGTASPAETSLIESSGSLSKLLDTLHDRGICSVELRMVSEAAEPADVLRAARKCHESGLSVTIHGAIYEPQTFLAPYSELLASGLQERYTVTVHTVGDTQTPPMLAALRHPQLRTALENNRRRGEAHMGQSCDGVLDLARRVGPSQGLCWDWGHYYWNLVQAGCPDRLPEQSFLRRVIHTHIHGVTNNTTHFPLTGENLPLCRYIRALEDAGYTGVYNLELSFPRFWGCIDPYEGLIRSIDVLKEACSHA